MNDFARGSYFDVYAKSPSGIEVALHLEIAPNLTPEEIADHVHAIDAELAKKRFVRSDRLDQRSGGGGGWKGQQQSRPELAPPAGIIRPEHCGVPMKYVRYKKDGAKGFPARNVDPGYADMWVCAKDKQCEDVTSGKSDRAHANFDMKVSQGNKPSPVSDEGEPQSPRQNARPTDIGYGDFLNLIAKEKFTRPMVLKFAKTNEEELKRMEPAAWLDILERMKEEKAAAAA